MRNFITDDMLQPKVLIKITIRSALLIIPLGAQAGGRGVNVVLRIVPLITLLEAHMYSTRLSWQQTAISIRHCKFWYENWRRGAPVIQHSSG